MIYRANLYKSDTSLLDAIAEALEPFGLSLMLGITEQTKTTFEAFPFDPEKQQRVSTPETDKAIDNAIKGKATRAGNFYTVTIKTKPKEEK